MDAAAFAKLMVNGYLWIAVIIALAIAVIRLWNHIVKETVPRNIYDAQQKATEDNIVEAVAANTQSVQMLSVKIDERIPQRGGN